MIFWADENFNGDILRALLRAYPHLDVIRVQDTHLISLPDPDLLDEASKIGAILLTHDVNTMSGFANERLRQGKRMSGVILIPQLMPIGYAIDELITFIGSANEGDFENMLLYI